MGERNSAKILRMRLLLLTTKFIVNDEFEDGSPSTLTLVWIFQGNLSNEQVRSGTFFEKFDLPSLFAGNQSEPMMDCRGSLAPRRLKKSAERRFAYAVGYGGKAIGTLSWPEIMLRFCSNCSDHRF